MAANLGDEIPPHLYPLLKSARALKAKAIVENKNPCMYGQYTYKTKLKLDKEVGGGFYLNCVPLHT